MLPRTSCVHCKKKLSEKEITAGWPLHTECIGPYAIAFREKQDRKRRKAMLEKAAQERKSIRARKAAMKGLPELKKEAQRAFNAFCRERDRGRGFHCVSCSRPLDWSGNRTDCGHFRSVGAAPHLRFNEDNAHAQCKYCNQYRSGNAVDYRIGLIQRIGLEAVERLESDNRIHRWTREELVSIRDTYRAKARELRKEREDA